MVDVSFFKVESKYGSGLKLRFPMFDQSLFERDNVNVHRAAANIIVSKSRAARGSVCNVLLSGVLAMRFNTLAGLL